MNSVTSADGTRIAFDRLGEGMPLVVVGGQLCDRSVTGPTAERLAQSCTVLNYDRRGRGESEDTLPYAVEREIEHLHALLDEAGAAAAVMGDASREGTVPAELLGDVSAPPSCSAARGTTGCSM